MPDTIGVFFSSHTAERWPCAEICNQKSPPHQPDNNPTKIAIKPQKNAVLRFIPDAIGYQWAALRKDGFLNVLKRAGFAVATRLVSHDINIEKAMPALSRWLSEMPRPLAVMASDDLPARHVLAACRELGLHVPEQVAVLGVDDDDVLSEMAVPPLSSIMQDCDRIGYEAAALLDQMMKQKRRSYQLIQIPPVKIVERQSTSVNVIEDADVANVLRLIRERASEPLSIKSLMHEIPMSRRTLERRFKAALGRSPADEIRRCRLERAMMLLRASSVKIDQVATKSGFGDARTMAVVFRREMKTSPSAFRRQFRDH